MRLIFGTKENLEKRAIRLVESKVREILQNKNYVVIGIPGGNSIRGIFSLLKQAKIPWKRTHIFMVDERKVPIFDSKSNFKLAREVFLKDLMDLKKIKRENIHAYNFKEPASNYYKELKKYGGKLDIVFLSAAEDSHVASLFPNHPSIKSTKPGYIDVYNAPSPPESRISASYSLLVKSGLGIMLFFGPKKKEAYLRFIDQKAKLKDCPSKIINRIKESYVLTDIRG